MRIHRLQMPRTDPEWKTASSSGSVVNGFVLEVETEEGTGIGSTAASRTVTADELAAQLDGPVRQILVGSDALLGNAIRGRLRESKLYARAIIAADLAIHDLVGKIIKAPCHVLWGGRIRSEIPVVRMVGLKAPLEMENAVGELIDEGYSHFKIKIGSGISEDVDCIRRLRDLFGFDVWISVDGNGAYTSEDAIALSRGLERYDVRVIEQPISYGDIEGLARVTAASDIPIMADQCVYDVASAIEVCQRKAAHVVSVKLLKMGSIDEALRVTEICQAFGVGVRIGGSVAPAAVDAAQTQLAATTSWISMECEVGEFLAVEGDLLMGLVVKRGCIELGDVPGLGVSMR